MKMNTLLALTLACSLFAATPAMAEQAGGNNGGTGIVQYSDVDQKLTESAEKAIEQYGNGKAFQLEEAFTDSYFVDKKKKENWIIQSKDRSAVVSVDAVSGKVLTISLSFKMDEVTDEYASYLKAAQSAAKQLSKNVEFVFTEAQFFQSNIADNKTESMTFGAKDNQFVQIDTKTNKPLNFRFTYKVADMDRKIIDVAEQAVKNMGIDKVQPFTNIEYEKYEGREEWKLARKIEVKGDPRKNGAVMIDENNRAFVVEAAASIEAKTGKLISINVKPATDNKKRKSLTKEQGVAIAKPVAKKLWGVDLSSYEVKVNKDWGDYTFSRKGNASIVAQFDNFGNLVRMERK
ncbi:hypothetical protein ABN764_08175 [Paenibacillaceae sp. P-4]|uniref:hypothetical protein n=1 Tax=Paenibacillaceae bacterium P-4 TaxID=3160969 RepID=UPI0032E83E71